MTGKIFLIQGDGSLQTMSEQPYPNEDLLQELLEKYPDLLAGDQMNEESPRRWLLISREIGVPGEEASVGWVDHLFLDQDAIPTLVEVKRSSDTRIRREVVGQMLDYAANAVVYLAPESLGARFQDACERRGEDPNQVVAALLGKSPDDNSAIDAFWRQVKTNLQAGRIRMVFVADKIPVELRRIVEFLNEQMDPAEVLAVEIRQYVGQGLQTLVPRVIGRTAEAAGKKSSERRELRQWDEPSFFEELRTRVGPEAVAVARQILTWARKNMPEIWWGKGKQLGSFLPGLTHNGLWHQVIGVWTNGNIELQFQYMQSKPPFHDDAKRLEFLKRLNQVPGITLPETVIGRRPSIPMSIFREETVLQQFLETLDWVVQQIKSGSAEVE